MVRGGGIHRVQGALGDIEKRIKKQVSRMGGLASLA